VVALREDGSGLDYTYPTGRGEDAYFKLPYDYWLSGQSYYVSLSFSAKVMLLISLSLKPPFILPTEKAKKWYGISPDSAERGLRELREADLLSRSRKSRDDWLTGTGKVMEYEYCLRKPFARQSRSRHLKVVAEAS
jgi:hypothetical protein